MIVNSLLIYTLKENQYWDKSNYYWIYKVDFKSSLIFFSPYWDRVSNNYHRVAVKNIKWRPDL